jgi:AraC-like DNA-binding protein
MDKKRSKFIKNKLVRKIDVTGIYTIHYFKYGLNFRFEEEKHDFWELMYIDSGNAIIVSNGKKIKLKQGEAFLHEPNSSHTIYTNNEFANSAIISFECKNQDLSSLSGSVLTFSEFDKLLLNKLINEAKLSFSDKLNDLYLKKMSKKSVTPFAYGQLIKNCIELLLISQLRMKEDLPQMDKISSISPVSDKIVESILQILQEKLEQSANVNLEEISLELKFSKSHIKTQFKKIMGVSILQYFIGLKMDKAKKLLSQQKYTISEISDILGFSSVYYFSRQFKLYTNMSPTKYVNSINADNVL